MIEVDLHCHSIFSLCGMHTILELLNFARKKGLKGLAITDHGLTAGGRLNSCFYERLEPNVVPGVRLLKGIECNILPEGKIDLPQKYIPCLDIVLAGIHSNIPKGESSHSYTKLMVKMIEQNPHVDIITHAYTMDYPLDLPIIALAAKKQNITIELNNSKNRPGKTPEKRVLEFLAICKEFQCAIALCSDTHAINELGNDEYINPLLKKADFPEELIVNNNAEKAFEFIQQRKKNRLDYMNLK